LDYIKDIDQYRATYVEESIFYLNENNKLKSMSDKLYCARYDGIDLKILKEDIKKI
jgi:hypothetical protein